MALRSCLGAASKFVMLHRQLAVFGQSALPRLVDSTAATSLNANALVAHGRRDPGGQNPGCPDVWPRPHMIFSPKVPHGLGIARRVGWVCSGVIPEFKERRWAKDSSTGVCLANGSNADPSSRQRMRQRRVR